MAKPTVPAAVVIAEGVEDYTLQTREATLFKDDDGEIRPFIIWTDEEFHMLSLGQRVCYGLPLFRPPVGLDLVRWDW